MGSVTASSFVAWVDGKSPAAIAIGATLTLLAAQLIVLGHELGHAAVGVLRSEGLVTVRIGRTPARWRCRVGRLQLELNLVPALSGTEGQARIHARLGRKSQAALALAGPVAGSLVAADLVLYGLRYHFQPLLFAGFVGGVLNLTNLVPFRRCGHRSDGGRVLDLLRSRGTAQPEDRLAAAYSRWIALVTDLRSVIAPEQLLRLGGAPVAVGYLPDDRSDAAVGLWRLAAAGWCWREAEHANLAAIRDDVLDERHAAAKREAGRGDIAVSAARELAVQRKDDPHLNDVFARLRPFFQQLRLRDEQERFAFRFGVALHDVEHIAG